MGLRDQLFSIKAKLLANCLIRGRSYLLEKLNTTATGGYVRRVVSETRTVKFMYEDAGRFWFLYEDWNSGMENQHDFHYIDGLNCSWRLKDSLYVGNNQENIDKVTNLIGSFTSHIELTYKEWLEFEKENKDHWFEYKEKD